MIIDRLLAQGREGIRVRFDSIFEKFPEMRVHALGR